MRLLLSLLLLVSAAAHAKVYKCVLSGKTTYTDRPCDAAALPANLPPINTEQPHKGDDLVKNYDERRHHDQQARDKADTIFLKSHTQKMAHEKSVREAISEHRAIKGMRASEVESALGRADEKRPDGSWWYRREGQRITVKFEAGQVSGVSTTTEKKKR